MTKKPEMLCRDYVGKIVKLTRDVETVGLVKMSDSRFEGYRTLHGSESWEREREEKRLLTHVVDE